MVAEVAGWGTFAEREMDSAGALQNKLAIVAKGAFNYSICARARVRRAASQLVAKYCLHPRCHSWQVQLF